MRSRPPPKGEIEGDQIQAPPPNEKPTVAYSQRSAGTHPTGMHSCFQFEWIVGDSSRKTTLEKGSRFQINLMPLKFLHIKFGPTLSIN